MSATVRQSGELLEGGPPHRLQRSLGLIKPGDPKIARRAGLVVLVGWAPLVVLAVEQSFIVPQPVPGKLFWSVTVYDAETRSEVQTDQAKAALRSLFELKDASKSEPVELFFGPTAPAGREARWIKTAPGKGWFAYMRIYGPEQAAFDRSWKPGDFEEVAPTVGSTK